MKKNFIRGIIVVIILFIVFNVLCFAIPFVHRAPFWLAYIFGGIAILVQLPLLYSAFGKGNTPKSRFYGFPIAQVGNFYLIIQLILSFLTMILETVLPVWLIIVLYVVVLATAAIGFVGVDAMRDEIERQEKTLVKSVDNMRSIQSTVNGLSGLCTDKELSKMISKLVEELKYSDPVSNEKTLSSEKELEAVLNELKETIGCSDKEKTTLLCDRAMMILSERNRLCKMNK